MRGAVKLKRLGSPIYIGIDAASKLMPIVAFVPGEETPRVGLYKLDDRAGARACGVAIRSVSHFIGTLPIDISTRLNLQVFIEQPVMYGGGRGAKAVYLQSFTSGAIQGAFAIHGASVSLVAPSRWKKVVVGRGNADKRFVASAVRRRWPDHYRLVAGSQDLIDAYCIARYSRSPVTS